MLMQRVEPAGGSTTPERRIRTAAVSMLARCVTAFFGGYAVAAALATFIARLLPLSRVEATVWGMIPAFLVYALVALWCFHEPRLLRVIGITWGGALLIAASIWILGVRP